MIEKFKQQYWQLMGYLNPYFVAGITLSINKKKGFEQTFDYICDNLEEMKQEGGEFVPIKIERIMGTDGTRYVKSEHIVPETEMKMPVYHLVLQLTGKERKMVARKARE